MVSTQGVKYIAFGLVLLAVIAAIAFVAFNLDAIVFGWWWLILIAVFILLAWKFDFVLTLKDYERAVIMRFGRVVRVGGPGWCFVFPVIESPTLVDLRTQTIDVPKQDVITKNNIELKVDAVIYLKVRGDKQSVIHSVVAVEDYKDAARLYVLSLIRDVIGSMALSDVIANIGDLSRQIKEKLSSASGHWGIEVEDVKLKDVDVPETVLEAMHLEKAAVQEKLARMERAYAQKAEIDAVREAAGQLSDKALAYYYIQALEKLGQGASTKFILPMEITKLAEGISKRMQTGATPEELEPIFQKYAPAIKAMLAQKADEGENKGDKGNSKKKK